MLKISEKFIIKSIVLRALWKFIRIGLIRKADDEICEENVGVAHKVWSSAS